MYVIGQVDKGIFWGVTGISRFGTVRFGQAAHSAQWKRMESRAEADAYLADCAKASGNANLFVQMV